MVGWFDEFLRYVLSGSVKRCREERSWFHESVQVSCLDGHMDACEIAVRHRRGPKLLPVLCGATCNIRVHYDLHGIEDLRDLRGLERLSTSLCQIHVPNINTRRYMPQYDIYFCANRL